MNDLDLRFARLFEGRKDAHGADHGKCIRHHVNPEYWQALFRRHLEGIEPIGVYPMCYHSPSQGAGGWYVKWGCSDIDVNDLQLAINLRTALKVLGITGHVEVSKSKGYHVWVFTHTWVPASTMRRALLAVHQLADVPATEVNPKQERLEGDRLGNYVRLPYPGALETGTTKDQRRMVLMDVGEHGRRIMFHSLFEFLNLAEAGASKTGAELFEAAKLYEPPVKHPPPIMREWDGVEPAQLNPLGSMIFREGPLEGRDRSTALFKLAVEGFRSDLDIAEVYALVEKADERWGKFVGRPDRQQRLEALVWDAQKAVLV